MSARVDLERLAAQLGDGHRVEQGDDGLWVVRTNSDGARVPVAFMPPAESTQSGETKRGLIRVSPSSAGIVRCCG